MTIGQFYQQLLNHQGQVCALLEKKEGGDSLVGEWEDIKRDIIDVYTAFDSLYFYQYFSGKNSEKNKYKMGKTFIIAMAKKYLNSINKV